MTVTGTLEGRAASTYRFFAKNGRRSAIFGEVRRQQMRLTIWNYNSIYEVTMANDSRRSTQIGYMIRDGIR
jgi:hypothetical protein